MNRRRLLLALPGLGFPGCLGWSTAARVGVAWIRLVNHRAEPHTVEVRIEDGGDAIFRESYRLGGNETGGEREIEPGVDGPGRYVARFTADGQTVTVDLVESGPGGGAAVGVRFEIQAGGTLAYETVSA
jgi:hypothetical protein